MLTDERVDELVQYDTGRVHCSIYTDPEIFQYEMERIFHRAWNYIGHESEISQTGDYKTTYIGQVPIILSRDEEGDVHVLVNRCLHRGTTVCQREHGNSNYFRCEYHGWTYKNDGALSGVRHRPGYSSEEFEALPKTLARVPRVASYRGLLFASFDPEIMPIEEYLGVAKDYLDDWLDTSPTGQMVVTGGVWKHLYEANWKLGLEGSDERYHVGALHRILSVSFKRETGTNLQIVPKNLRDLATKDAGHGHGISEMTSEAFPYPWRDLYPQEYVDGLVERLGEKRTTQVLSRSMRLHLFPNVSFGPYDIRVFRPISPDRTEVHQYHVALPDIPGVTERVNEQRIKTHADFYGPAGLIGADDLEMFPRLQEGYRAQAIDGVTPWVWFNRGSSSAQRDQRGALVGEDQCELSQRSIYGGWSEFMKRQPSQPAQRKTKVKGAARP